MHSAIQVRSEGRRGCGWRKVGGLYLVSSGEVDTCARLPIPLATCPCCGRGMKPARGWTWVDGDELLRASPECPDRGTKHCELCAIHNWIRHGLGQCGLIWIGETHYPTIGHFNREADEMGVSRRIQHVPKKFVFGETIVLLAHKKAIIGEIEMGKEIEYSPGIFRIFKPTAIERIVTGEESTDEIDAMVKRGLTPVMIERVEATQETMLDAA